MELFLPDIYQKSIYTIDYSKLLSRGIKCLLFDLDNTIVPGSTSQPSSKTKDLFTSLKQKGFKVIIFTNSPKIRLRGFQKALGVDGVSNACKPLTFKLRKLLKEYNFGINEVAIIGDQLMTDIMVGNSVGITSVLVNPISEKDFLVTKFNRFLEKRKMNELADKGLFYKGKYYE